MVIKNSTCWRTDDLRMLFRRCVKEVDKVEKPNYPFYKRNKHFTLDIFNQKNWSGRAIVNGYWIRINIAKHISETKHWTDEDKKQLANIMIHEYYHIIGYRHNGSFKGIIGEDKLTESWNYGWLNQYPIREKEVVKKEAVDIKLLRYQRAIQNLRKAETRFRRAKTLYRKWLLKVKRYEVVYNFKKS